MSYPRLTPFIGMKEDLEKRLPLYLNDFTNFFNMKVSASILYMFFTSIGPAITFANLLQEKTGGEVGVLEVMFSTAICGVCISLFAGQPLVIVGVTGPVSILTIAIFDMADRWNLNFLPFYAWSQIWAAIMLILQAILNHCDMVPWVSRFSCEIFGVLIALIYIYSGIAAMYDAFDGGNETGIFQLLISLGMLWTSMQLSDAKSWVITSSSVRDVIADYGASVSLLFWTAVIYFPGAKNVDVGTLEVPDRFDTTTGRAWFVDLSDIPAWGIFAALLPGFIIAVLFFFDHNVSSLMCQDPAHKLKKPAAFHWDYFIVGICLFVTGLLGIPPTNGLIPQAPLHAKSLLIREQVEDTSEGKPAGSTKLIVVGCYEQRISNLFTSILIGLMCFNPFLKIVRLIPTAALSGLFLFMGVSSFAGNQFVERLMLLVTEPALRVSQHMFLEGVEITEMMKFTLLQLGICLTIFVITFTQAAMVFPVLIGVLVPFRLVSIPQYFSAAAVMYMDLITNTDHSEGSEEQYATVDGDTNQPRDMVIEFAEREQQSSDDVELVDSSENKNG
jgi:hypothetical protein